jgi:hypothetical protein
MTDRPAQAMLWPDIKQLHDAIAECIGREGLTYSGIRRAAKQVQELYAATIAAEPPAAPVELSPEQWVDKLREVTEFAETPFTRCSAGTDQEGWDLVAKSWVVLESYGFAPEACDYLPQAIDNALAAVIGARDDLLAEVTRLRAAPQTSKESDEVLRLRAAMDYACDLLAERTYGSPARSPAHNARLHLEGALAHSRPHHSGDTK